MEDWRVLADKEGTSRDGEWGEEHSVLPGVKSGGLEGISGQRVVSRGGERDKGRALRPSRGEKWRIGGY